MRARAAFLAGAGSAAILAIGWNAGVAAFSNSTTTTSTPAAAGYSGSSAGSSSSDSSTTTDSSSATPSTAPSPSTPTVADGTYQGQAVGYQYGAVQVSVVISGGAITGVNLDQATATRGRDQAFPMLVDETVQAQSANIANLGGATFTCAAYHQSLQSALDAAGWQG